MAATDSTGSGRTGGRPRPRSHAVIVVCWLIVTVCCLLPNSGHAKVPRSRKPSRYLVAWVKEVRQIDKLLAAKDWKGADDRAETLLKKISRHVLTGGGEIIGAAVLERAVALAGLGNMRDAEWYACMANDFWDHAVDQLLYYGDIGRRLRQALPGGDQEEPDGKPVVVEEGGGKVIIYPSQLRVGAHEPVFRGHKEGKGGHLTAPVVLYKRQPHYPEGVRWSRAQDSIAVMTMIDEHGIPSSPTIVQGSSYVTLVYTALDALKDWRFKPATWNGKPVRAEFVLHVHFRLSR